VTDEAGRTTSREYLQNGWLKRIVRPNGDFIQYTYDKVARLTKVEEIAANTWGGAYAKRATLEVKYGYGTYTATIGTGFTQEANYNRWVEYITKKTDQPLYYGTVYFFDKNDRLAEVRFLDANDTLERKYKYTYDGFGNLVKVEKPDAATIDYTYNKLNQMTQEKFDANNFNDYEYCCCSVVKHQQTVAGSQLNPYELTMDKLHRLTKEQYPDAGNPKTQYFEYKYDNAGRRIEMTDPTYGRAAVEPKPQRWAYEQDRMLINVGHSQNVDYLRNRGEDYGVMYDSRGRISRVLYPGDNNQPVMEVEYQYNDGNQITKIIARNLTAGSSTDIYCMEYEYDGNGRKVRQVIKETEADLDTDAYYVTSFNYDSRDMLTEEKYLRWDDANTVWKVMYWGRYSYDIAGNMVNRVVSQIVNGVAKMYIDGPFTYSRGYQLRYFNRTDPGNAETRAYNLTYDANGNVTHIQRQQGQQPFTDSFYEITEMEFDYDAKNRMVKYRFGGAGSWYDIKYDALGRVRERVDLTPTTTKYYSDGRQLVQQLDSSNNAQFDYLRGATGLDRQWNETNDTRRFYIKDNLGTVWAIVNPSDLSVKRYNYNAWGEHLDKDDTDFPTDTNYMRYIGCRVEAFGKGSTTQRDAIYHLDHRHYLAFTGQFTQIDPQYWREHIYYSPYSYTNNQPTIKSDYSGLQPVTGGMGSGNCCEIDDPILKVYLQGGDDYKNDALKAYVQLYGTQTIECYPVFKDLTHNIPTENNMLNCCFRVYRKYFYPYKCTWTFPGLCSTRGFAGPYDWLCGDYFAQTYQECWDSAPFIWRNREGKDKYITVGYFWFLLITDNSCAESNKCRQLVDDGQLVHEKAFVSNIPCTCGKEEGVLLSATIRFTIWAIEQVERVQPYTQCKKTSSCGIKMKGSGSAFGMELS